MSKVELTPGRIFAGSPTATLTRMVICEDAGLVCWTDDSRDLDGEAWGAPLSMARVCRRSAFLAAINRHVFVDDVPRVERACAAIVAGHLSTFGSILLKEGVPPDRHLQVMRELAKEAVSRFGQRHMGDVYVLNAAIATAVS